MKNSPKISFTHSTTIQPTTGNAKKSHSMEHSRTVDSLSRETEVINKVTSSLLPSLSKKTDHSQPREK
jgi:hypothetical protein